MCRIPSRVGAHFGVLSRLLVVRSRNDQFRLKEDSDSRQPTAICNTADYRFFYCRNGEMGSYCDVTIDVGDPFSPHSPAISGYCRVPSIHFYRPLYLDMYIDRKVFIHYWFACRCRMKWTERSPSWVWSPPWRMTAALWPAEPWLRFWPAVSSRTNGACKSSVSIFNDGDVARFHNSSDDDNTNMAILRDAVGWRRREKSVYSH